MATPKLTLNHGDKVICINAENSRGILTKGQTYTVAEEFRTGVTLVGYGSFNRNRFRKVTTRAKAGMGMGKSHKSKRQQTETKMNKLANIMTMPREKAIATVLGMIRDELKNNF